MIKFIWRVIFCLEFDCLQETTGKKHKTDRELWRFSDCVYKDAGRWFHPVASARTEFIKCGKCL